MCHSKQKANAVSRVFCPFVTFHGDTINGFFGRILIMKDFFKSDAVYTGNMVWCSELWHVQDFPLRCLNGGFIQSRLDRLCWLSSPEKLVRQAEAACSPCGVVLQLPPVDAQQVSPSVGHQWSLDQGLDHGLDPPPEFSISLPLVRVELVSVWNFAGFWLCQDATNGREQSGYIGF